LCPLLNNGAGGDDSRGSPQKYRTNNQMSERPPRHNSPSGLSHKPTVPNPQVPSRLAQNDSFPPLRVPPPGRPAEMRGFPCGGSNFVPRPLVCCSEVVAILSISQPLTECPGPPGWPEWMTWKVFTGGAFSVDSQSAHRRARLCMTWRFTICWSSSGHLGKGAGKTRIAS